MKEEENEKHRNMKSDNNESVVKMKAEMK